MKAPHRTRRLWILLTSSSGIRSTGSGAGAPSLPSGPPCCCCCCCCCMSRAELMTSCVCACVSTRAAICTSSLSPTVRPPSKMTRGSPSNEPSDGCAAPRSGVASRSVREVRKFGSVSCARWATGADSRSGQRGSVTSWYHRRCTTSTLKNEN